MEFNSRRRVLLAACALPLIARAQTSADKGTVRFLVGFAPGGGTDLVARLIAEKLRDLLGQNVIVENLAGAGGRLAANALVAAAPDGNTYMVANNAVHTFQTLVFGSQLKWNYKQDFAPVAGLTAYPLGLAVPASLGIRTLPEFARWLKSDPAHAQFGTTGLGGQTHFLGEALGKSLGIELRAVPYKGPSPMVADLVAGHLPSAIGLMDDMLKFHRAGSVRVICIFSARHSALIPDIPTAIEQGVNMMPSEGWQGIWAPARTAQTHIDQMQSAIRKVLEMPDVQQAMTTRLNVQPNFRSASELALVQDAEMKLWAPIIKSSGFKPE
jgi:tripartite-type tricarboxylate transporter receptor subunit TctC